MRSLRCAFARARRPLAVAAALAVVASACEAANGGAAPVVVPVETSVAPVTVAVTAAPTTAATPTSTTTSTLAPSTTASTTTTSTTTSTTLAPTTQPPTTPEPTEPPPPKVTAASTPLRAIGTKSGSEAARVQQRLLDLGFWVAGVDGEYGGTTRQGVLAFQKYYGLKRSGSVDKATAEKLTSLSQRATAKSGSGTLIEIDKDRQVLMIVRNGRLLHVLNTSTGNGQYYLEQNQKDPTRYESGRSVTPSGRFKVYRQREDGWWEGDLGKIYRPKYFNGGIAMHGMSNVPAYPASHGCVRLSIPAMDMVWDLGFVSKGTPVWVYGSDVPAKGDPPKPPTSTTTTKPNTSTTKPNVTTTTKPPTSSSSTTTTTSTTSTTTTSTTTTTIAP